MPSTTEPRPYAFPATCVACRVEYLSTASQPDHDHTPGTRPAPVATLASLFGSSERDDHALSPR